MDRRNTKNVGGYQVLMQQLLRASTYPSLSREPKKFLVNVPDGKKSGDEMVVAIDDYPVTIRIPKEKTPGHLYRPADNFNYKRPAETNKVIASTLQTIPGMEVVQAKPIIWSTASHAFFKLRLNDQETQIHMTKKAGPLLAEAQEALLESTIAMGCNACLGITSNVAIDSSGDRGKSKIVMVTLMGTPCVILPTSNLPVIDAAVTLVPLFAEASAHEEEEEAK
jgi:hypothetical protein